MLIFIHFQCVFILTYCCGCILILIVVSCRGDILAAGLIGSFNCNHGNNKQDSWLRLCGYISLVDNKHKHKYKAKSAAGLWLRDIHLHSRSFR